MGDGPRGGKSNPFLVKTKDSSDQGSRKENRTGNRLCRRGTKKKGGGTPHLEANGKKFNDGGSAWGGARSKAKNPSKTAIRGQVSSSGGGKDPGDGGLCPFSPMTCRRGKCACRPRQS